MTVHVTLDSENRQVLWPPQDSPVFSIQDNIRNLVMVKGPTQKELRRNHGCLWKEHLNLNLKWSDDCTTGKEITELVSTATLMKLMPRQMATYVRYSNSKTMKETIGLADEFWGGIRNGRMRLLPREIGLPTNESSTEWTTSSFRRTDIKSQTNG